MRIRPIHLLAPALALAVILPAEAFSQARGGARGGAPVARAAVGPGPAQRVDGPRDVRSSARSSVNPQGRGNVNVGSGGNTVVVNNGRPMDQRRYGAPPPGYRPGGYYYGGGYYYDDNDNEFLEFVGKTAAVTAGAAIVGSIVTSKPSSDCQEQMSGGQVYLYCNGKYYQPVQTSSGTGYQVVNAPPK